MQGRLRKVLLDLSWMDSTKQPHADIPVYVARSTRENNLDILYIAALLTIVQDGKPTDPKMCSCQRQGPGSD